jgi:hypothetical protein
MAKLTQRANMLSGKAIIFVLIPKNTDYPFVINIYLAFCCYFSSDKIY